MKTLISRRKAGYLLLLLVALFVISTMVGLAPIAQDPGYHNFSDKREILGVPNFWNVLSNLPFLFIGLLGLFKLHSDDIVKTQYIIFFIGVSLVAFGSAYYHLNPNNDTLVWDRLPMTIGFMALFSAVISEFINDKFGKSVFIPALIIGLSSVIYWVIMKDLSLYMVVQFFPMLAIPVMLIFFKSRYNLTAGYWLLLLAYVIAKVCEKYDYEAHDFLGFISGHSLKHIFAALGIYMMILKRIDQKIAKKSGQRGHNMQPVTHLSKIY